MNRENAPFGNQHFFQPIGVGVDIGIETAAVGVFSKPLEHADPDSDSDTDPEGCFMMQHQVSDKPKSVTLKSGIAVAIFLPPTVACTRNSAACTFS